MPLIDADALKKAIDISFLDEIKLGSIINNAPTIDAVEAVRCKDCKCWNNRHSGDTYCHRLGICMTKADDYCSFGERREP